jgi:hypothetical protein
MDRPRNSDALSQNPIEGPGPGIAQLRADLTLRPEWTSELVSAQKLGQIANDLGFGNFSKHDILGLWHIGLLRADYVESERPMQIAGLIPVERGGPQYLDIRAMEPRPEGYGSSMPEQSKDKASNNEPRPDLKFHPNRVYVLHHVVRTLVMKTSACQYLLWKSGLESVAGHALKQFDRWSSSPAFSDRFDYWNQLAELASACAVVLWLPPENHRASRNTFSWLPAYVEMVRGQLKRSGLSMIRQCREDLAWAAHTTESNDIVHTLLRLTRRSERDRIKDQLGAAMKFLDMAESMRRASERLLNIDLPEEDELGPGQWMEGARKTLYGHERVFDAPRRDLRDFLGILGLDFGVKVRCYVEGETELGAFRHAVGADGLCSLVNLKGNVVQRQGKGMAFADSLAEDMRHRIISVVVVDGDRTEVVRTLRRAASEKRMHGPFFLSDPDFEFANFTVEELLRVAIAMDLEARFDDDEVNERLPEVLPSVAGAKSAKEFIALTGMHSVGKGEKWGEALMTYAIAHPKFPDGDERAGTEREIVDAARVLIRAQDVGYLRSVEHEELDPDTGRMVKRQKPS